MSLKDKMAQSGFTPTQRALDADAFIASRNPQDNPDEFTFLGSMGYVYTGPASFYTSGSEYTAWLNSQLGNKPFKDATDVARAIDANPKIPKGTGIFAPIGGVTDTAGMLTSQTPDKPKEVVPDEPPKETRASVADINALYQKYLGRDAKQSGLDYWRSTGEYADRGIQSLEDIEYNISISKEAQDRAAAQQQTDVGTTTVPSGTTTVPSGTTTVPSGTTTVPSGSTFTPSTPQGLTYTPVSLPSVAPAPSVQNVDYVKMLRGALANSLFKDLV